MSIATLCSRLDHLQYCKTNTITVCKELALYTQVYNTVTTELSTKEHALQNVTLTRTLLEESSLLSCLVSLSNVLPVDHFPDGFDVLRPHVLVLQVVGVLPDINTKQRDETCIHTSTHTVWRYHCKPLLYLW